MTLTPPHPLSAFDGVPPEGAAGAVIAIERELGIARLTARNGQREPLERLFHKRYGIALPKGARRARWHELAVAGIAPESWMMTCEGASDAFAATLRSAFGGHASIVDLTDAYATLRLEGPRVRESLAKLVPIDLHERTFAPGDIAQTVAAHMSVTLWRLEDAEQHPPVFEICVGRSFAHSLYRAIRASAAEFGFVFRAAVPSAPRAPAP